MISSVAKIFVPGKAFLEAIEDVPAVSVVYFIFIREGWRLIDGLNLKSADLERPPAFNGADLMYIGMSPHSIQARLSSHFCSDPRMSSFRRTLGLLLKHELNLDMHACNQRAKFQFGSGEARLTDWIVDRGYVSYILSPSAETLEEFLIKSFHPPLNISFRKTHPLSRHLMLRSKSLRLARAAGGNRPSEYVTLNERRAGSVRNHRTDRPLRTLTQ